MAHQLFQVAALDTAYKLENIAKTLRRAKAEEDTCRIVTSAMRNLARELLNEAYLLEEADLIEDYED